MIYIGDRHWEDEFDAISAIVECGEKIDASLEEWDEHTSKAWPAGWTGHIYDYVLEERYRFEGRIIPVYWPFDREEVEGKEIDELECNIDSGKLFLHTYDVVEVNGWAVFNRTAFGAEIVEGFDTEDEAWAFIVDTWKDQMSVENAENILKYKGDNIELRLYDPEGNPVEFADYGELYRKIRHSEPKVGAMTAALEVLRAIENRTEWYDLTDGAEGSS